MSSEQKGKTARFGYDTRKGEIFAGSWRMRLPRSRKLRIAIAVLLICGGVLGFLPVLGFWMLPLGFLLLSAEFHLFRRIRRRFVVWWSRRKAGGNSRLGS